ncbi:MAG: hypothetical protein A2901_03625 [Elusimicrobia bacterium RIFCSPLOWO2_01_FULL_54_10]|nr:MAG: hypothetical protein A2901_03625 [Elusimicrobia bacterium RIFCSPLOWO2_01_FULL_54_10]
MNRLKKWNIILYAAIFAAVSFGGQGVRLLTDYLWYQEVGFTEVFTRTLMTQGLLWGAAALIMGGALILNWRIALNVCKRPFVVIEPESVISPLPLPQISGLKPFLRTLFWVFAFMVSLVAANWAAGRWEMFLKFQNAVSFGVLDPVFGRDISFYVFSLPFYKFLLQFFLIVVILSLSLTVVIYAVNARIFVTPRGIKTADGAKIHWAVLGGFFCLLMAFHYQIKSYDLLLAQRTLAPGAGFADLNAYLPGLKILRVVALISALLLWASAYRMDLKLIAGAVLLTFLGPLLARTYSETVQKFKVAPNEIAMESPYIEQAIKATREAYGLSNIEEKEFDPQENLTSERLKANDLTVKNIRLWEHRPLLTSYGQLQEIRTYYDFLDADNDRYFINGELRQVMLSVRELVPESLPSRIWINEHLTYTHGYGIVMGPVNRISPEGLPEFFIKDIPPKSETGIAIARPEIYYGESRANYAIVKTGSKEFDYPSGDENVYTTYQGLGGVPAKGLLRRLLFALRFGELKILFSGDIEPESRFLYYRQVRERASKAAPFVRFEFDPYAVVTNEGRIVWLIDGYTSTDHYPYSEKFGDMNYVRNSVKAVVDAYDGTVRLYISDADDPLIQTYARIFPGVFEPISAMPEDVRAHIRYPQTLMNIQARVYATYHVTDPQVFYNKEDLWKIPQRTAGGTSQAMEPYYTVMKLAGLGGKEEFILMVPFTPSKKENMIAWMAARCDAPNYGKLLVYNFPKQKLVYGPQQIESRMDQDAEISKQITLWDQGGSRVLRGSLLVIPVDQSLLYVQPLYLEASGGGLPELKRVIVAYGNSIAMEENLELCLARIFGGRMERRERSDSPPASDAGAGFRRNARQAQDHFDRAQKAMRAGDWAVYGAEMEQVGKILRSLGE